MPAAAGFQGFDGLGDRGAIKNPGMWNFVPE